MKKSAFSLMELMVAVSVLSIGIVLIARSFLSASNALGISEDKIAAMSYLERKMCEVEEKALEPEAKFDSIKEETAINGKTAEFNSDSEDIYIGKDKDGRYISRITLSVGWKEGGRSYDGILATYIKNEKKKGA